MSELVLNSFQQSTISQTFKKLGHDNPVSGIVPSRPPSTRETLVTPSRNTHTSLVKGAQSVMDVPRYGHLAKAFIEYKYTLSTAGTAINFPVGFTFAQNISLQTANRSLYDQQDLATLGRVQTSPVEKADFLTRMAEKLNATTNKPLAFNNGASSVSYCEIFAPFFEDERNYYDAVKNESLRVVVTFNGLAEMGLPSTVVFSSIECTLYTWHVKYDSETEKMLIDANRKPTIPLQMLGYSHFMESLDLAPGSTTASIIMNSDVPAVRTYVRVRNLTTNVASGRYVEEAGAADQVPTFITKYKIKINGQEYQTEIPKLIGQAWGFTKGQGGTIVSAGGANAFFTLRRVNEEIVCINWAHDVMDHTYSSGYLPLVALNRPEITVTLQAPTVAATPDARVEYYNIEYCHEYLVMYSQDSSNGQVMIYTSS